MRSAALKGILLVAFCLVICFPASAQGDSPQKSAPALHVTIVPPTAEDIARCKQGWPKPSDSRALGLDMSYAGEKALRGYELAILQGGQPWGYSEGAFFHDLTSHELKPPERELMQPGMNFHSAVCGSQDADISKISANVDLLIFEDGTISGPVSLHQSQVLFGAYLGARGDADEGKFVTRVPVGSDTAGDPITIENEPLPLQFSGIIERGDSGKANLVIRAVNKGDVAVLGYVFKISFYDHATGAFVRSVTTKAVSTNPLPPGGIWHSIGRRLSVSSDGEFDTYKVSVDMVQLANGKLLGPRRSAESYEVSGMINVVIGRRTLADGTASVANF
ncbi:MAG TPA: hypothetical protein VIH72_00975 [Candidatus Acidoferrales bacterium]